VEGSTTRRDAELILGARPFFLKYLHAKFEDESRVTNKGHRAIICTISDTIATFERLRGDEIKTPYELEQCRQQYKRALLESIADTMQFPALKNHKELYNRPRAARKAKLYGPLILASLVGEIAIVEKILAEGVNVNMYHPYFGTALCASARSGRIAVAELLLQRGADMIIPLCNTEKACLGMHRLPLVTACFQGHEEIVRLMLKSSNNLQGIEDKRPDRWIQNQRTDHFKRCIGAAFRGGHLSLVKFMIKQNILPLKKAQAMVFHAAACSGSVEMIKSLIASGFDVKNEEYFKTGWSSYPLDDAAGSNKIPTLKLLLQLGLQKGPRRYGRAMHEAARRGNLQAAKTLIEDGARILRENGAYRSIVLPRYMTPLQLSLWCGQEEMTAYLLKQTGKQGLDELGPRVLSGLAVEGKINMIRILLQAGADPNSYPPSFPEHTPMPPILVAKARNDKELVDLFLRFGAKPVDPLSQPEYSHYVERITVFRERMKTG
jgi:ankyrin repeat protein